MRPARDDPRLVAGPEPRLLPTPARHAIVLRTAGDAPLLGHHHAAGFRVSPFGLVARHYWHQLPHKFLHLRAGEPSFGPACLEGTLERLALLDLPRSPPLGSVTVGDALAWFLRMTTTAYRRGIAVRGWDPADDPLWAPPILLRR